MVKIWEDLQTILGKKQEEKNDFGKYGNKIQWPLLPFPIQILSKITLLKRCGWSAGFIVNVQERLNWHPEHDWMVHRTAANRLPL